MILYPPILLVMSTIVFYDNASGMCPPQNATFIILTSSSNFSVFGSFYLIDSLSHVFRCYAFMPNGLPAHPIHTLRTVNAIYSHSGCPFKIITGCTSIGIDSPSDVIRL